MNEPHQNDATAWLTPGEAYAYEYFCSRLRRAGADTYPIAQSVADQLAVQFLNGRSLEEIRKSSPNFSMGQIVHAAVSNRWDLLRATYAETMLHRAKYRSMVAVSEAVDLAADMIAALRSKYGASIMVAMKEGKAADLPIRELREVSDILMKLTGQEQRKSVKIEGEVKHTGQVFSIPTEPPKPLPQQEAAKTLEAWVMEAKKKNE